MMRGLRLSVGTGVCAVALAVVGLSTASNMARAAEVPGVVVAFWRFAVAAVAWQIIARFTAVTDRIPADGRTSRVGGWWRTKRLHVLAGVVFGLDLAAYFTAANLTPIANVEFVVALSPFFVLPLAAWWLAERAPRGTVALGAIAVVGVALVVFGDGATDPMTDRAGGLLALVTALLWAGYLVVSKVARRTTSTVTFMSTVCTTAAVTVLPFAASTGQLLQLSFRDVVLVVALGIVYGQDHIGDRCRCPQARPHGQGCEAPGSGHGFRTRCGFFGVSVWSLDLAVSVIRSARAAGLTGSATVSH